MSRFSCLAMCSRLQSVLLGLSLVACGDPLVGAGYQGVPLMQLGGQVIIDDVMDEPQGEIRVAVYWSSRGEHGLEHQQETRVGTSFPANYTLTLYTPPPDEVLYQPPHAGAPMAIGVPIVYDDIGGDGGFSDGDTVLGGSQDVLILYAMEAEEHQPPPDGGGGGPDDTGGPGPGDDPGPGNGEPLEAGYHAVSALGGSCDAEYLVLNLVDPTEVTMAVGELWDNLVDMDCDGDIDEWGEL